MTTNMVVTDLDTHTTCPTKSATPMTTVIDLSTLASRASGMMTSTTVVTGDTIMRAASTIGPQSTLELFILMITPITLMEIIAMTLLNTSESTITK